MQEKDMEAFKLEWKKTKLPMFTSNMDAYIEKSQGVYRKATRRGYKAIIQKVNCISI